MLISDVHSRSFSLYAKHTMGWKRTARAERGGKNPTSEWSRNVSENKYIAGHITNTLTPANRLHGVCKLRGNSLIILTVFMRNGKTNDLWTHNSPIIVECHAHTHIHTLTQMDCYGWFGLPFLLRIPWMLRHATFYAVAIWAYLPYKHKHMAKLNRQQKKHMGFTEDSGQQP